MVSGAYPDGRRVIWSNGRQTIAKLDHDTLEVLAVLPTGDERVTPVEVLEDDLRGLDELRGRAAVDHALTMALTYLVGLDGVYALVDRDNTLFLTRKTASSPIARPTRPTRPLPSRSRPAGTSRPRSDAIPEDWAQLPDAPSRRIAGLGRADMGDPDRAAIQTEQSITVSGYGAMTVNNQPPTLVEGLPEAAGRALCFYLGHDPAFRPLGLHEFEWNPATRTVEEAWVCTTVLSPNSVPYVSQGSGLVYTCGTRDRRWTIEAVD